MTDIHEAIERHMDVDPKDIQDWLDCDQKVDACEVMTDEMIVDYIKAPVLEEDDEKEEVKKCVYNDTKAYECISYFLKWLNSSKTNNTTQVEVLHAKGFKQKALTYKEQSTTQKCIKNFRQYFFVYSQHNFVHPSSLNLFISISFSNFVFACRFVHVLMKCCDICPM